MWTNEHAEQAEVMLDAYETLDPVPCTPGGELEVTEDVGERLLGDEPVPEEWEDHA